MYNIIHIYNTIQLFSVTEYIMKYSNNFEKIRSSFREQPSVTSDMMVSGSLTHPAAAGNVETVIIRIPTEG
jgi:hypothetical protein